MCMGERDAYVVHMVRIRNFTPLLWPSVENIPGEAGEEGIFILWLGRLQ